MAQQRRAPDPKMLLAALVALAIGAFALLQIGSRNAGQSESETGVSDSVAIGGPFTLTDQDGRSRTDADFRGSLMLVYFGYTYCPDVCPLTLATMGAAVDSLGEKGKEIAPIFITVDPDRDTPAKMKEYAARFSPRLVALTGTKDQIAQAAKAYHIYYAKHEDSSTAYTMDHSSIVYLMSRNGKYFTHFSPDTSAQDMAARIAKFL